MIKRICVYATKETGLAAENLPFRHVHQHVSHFGSPKRRAREGSNIKARGAKESLASGFQEFVAAGTAQVRETVQEEGPACDAQTCVGQNDKVDAVLRYHLYAPIRQHALVVPEGDALTVVIVVLVYSVLFMEDSGGPNPFTSVSSPLNSYEIAPKHVNRSVDGFGMNPRAATLPHASDETKHRKLCHIRRGHEGWADLSVYCVYDWYTARRSGVGIPLLLWRSTHFQEIMEQSTSCKRDLT
jgi:hypothetical protein